MSNRSLLILGLAAAVMVTLAVVLSGITSRPYARATASAYLIQGLDPDQIASITIGRGSEQVVLNRRGQGFVVASKDNYPALTSEINKLITTCLDIQTAELYTDNPANHKDLGVTEEDARHLVKFFKADSSLLTGVVIGKPIEKSPGGYVRRVEDNKVYVMAAQVPWIKKRATEYVEQGLTNVKREDIESVTVNCPNETYVLRPGDGKTVVLDNLPEGKKLKSDVANRVFTALANLRFDDVNADGSTSSPSKTSQPRLKFDRKYVCRLKDSTVYTFWLAKNPASHPAGAEAGGDNWLVRCDALFMDKTPVTKTQGEVESEDQLKKKEAKLLASDAAEEFSEKHKGWVYQIPAYNAENLNKPIAELVEDTEKKEQADGGFDKLTTGEPNETIDGNLQEEAEEEIKLPVKLNSSQEQ